MNHVDLFSGIGGFALAARNVWGGAYHNVCFCDNNIFCQHVLRKNFGKESLIYGDIRELTRDRVIADTNGTRRGTPAEDVNTDGQEIEQEREKQPQFKHCGRIDLLTGGFPCQPFSQAGKRRGTADDRFLWPEMLRVISELRPRYIVAENVAGLFSILEPESISEVEHKEIGLFQQDENYPVNTVIERIQRRVIGSIIKSIEQNGYDLPRFSDGTPIVLCIPACAVNAPHRRDRVWIVANRDTGGRRETFFRNEAQRREPHPHQQDSHASDTRYGMGRTKQGEQQEERPQVHEGSNGDAQDSVSKRSRGRVEDNGQILERQTAKAENAGSSWSRNWIEVATRFCRVDDGLPAELDGFKLTKSKHREERLRALGNAIVPQVAEEIFRAIRDVEK